MVIYLNILNKLLSLDACNYYLIFSSNPSKLFHWRICNEASYWCVYQIEKKWIRQWYMEQWAQSAKIPTVVLERGS